MGKTRTYNNYILTLFLFIGFIIGSIGGNFIVDNYFTFSILKGNSMLPEYKTHDVVLLKIVNECKVLSVGDDITFKYNDHYIFHRIINIQEPYLITTGINNDYDDPIIKCEHVVGKKILHFKSFNYRLSGVLI